MVSALQATPEALSEDDGLDLFAQHRACRDPLQRKAHKDEIVSRYGLLARRVARRYAHRGENLDDLQQVAFVALVAAIDRFDETRGIPFERYAHSSIAGELKRHFRDKRWAMRVPRGVQELALMIPRAQEDLTSRLRRSPTTAEVAAACGTDVDSVLEAMDAAQNYTVASLECKIQTDNGEAGDLKDLLGSDDPGFEHVEYISELPAALEELSEIERTVIYYRFFEGELQWQIAERLEVSQMQVSRLLARALAKLRVALAPRD